MRSTDRTAEATLQVSHTAETTRLFPDDGFLAVLPIARIVALMELAAARLMSRALRDGRKSVSIAVHLTHAAHALVCGPVRAVASYREIVRREHRFTVHAFDETGLIASAEHTRAVVAERPLVGMAPRGAGRRSLQLNV